VPRPPVRTASRTASSAGTDGGLRGGRDADAVIGELRAHLAELAPVLRRAVNLDASALARIRAGSQTVSVFVTLPFRVLVSRTIAIDADVTLDATMNASDVLAWLDDPDAAVPRPRDEQWRGALPPRTGWRRLDAVPDDVVRNLVRSGALALKEAAEREGVPGAQPRAEVADALLDAVVLTVSDDAGAIANIELRTISSLVRMGFVPRGSQVTVDRSGRWTRVSGEYGSAYAAERGGLDLASR